MHIDLAFRLKRNILQKQIVMAFTLQITFSPLTKLAPVHNHIHFLSWYNPITQKTAQTTIRPCNTSIRFYTNSKYYPFWCSTKKIISTTCKHI